jgi:sterol desaturase/sphingolipid hydroxylase (fatty acid hydroxylase superfamily)
MEAFLQYASRAYALNYFGIVLVVAVLEWVVPRRLQGDTRGLRWLANIGITVLDALVVRLLFPLLGAAWAAYCGERGWGLFNQVAFPGWLVFFVTLMALDVVAYAQHVFLHRVPWLWRFHRTHHTDQDFDFTTGLRFHPIESVYTTTVVLGTILVLGASPGAVLVSQLLSVAMSFLEHANMRMPMPLDRLLRRFLVTPDVHRIHHSQVGRENRSNLGNIFSWWDRMFGTYVDQPAAGHDGIAFGLAEFSERKHLTLPWMLAQPFLREQGEPPVDARSSGTEANRVT